MHAHTCYFGDAMKSPEGIPPTDSTRLGSLPGELVETTGHHHHAAELGSAIGVS